MKQNNLKTLLRELRTPPVSGAWVSKTKLFLRSKSRADVTDLSIKRTQRYKLFNLLYLPNMNGKFNSMVSIISILATLTVGGGTVYASDSAVPGDFLFSVDKSTEAVQRFFTTSPLSEAKFELKVLDERIAELDQLSIANDVVSLTKAITEVETQTGVIQEQLKLMDQLRIEDKLQTQEQQQLMEQLRIRVQEQTATMQQTQTKLQSGGDMVNSDNLKQIQNKYSDSIDSQIKDFEDSTGVKIENQESQQNQGEDTQIQNQNQLQNQGEESGGTQDGSGSGQQGGTTTPQQSGKK